MTWNDKQLELARQRINQAAFVDFDKPFKEGWYWECRKCHQKLCEDYPDITIARIEKALAKHSHE